MKIVFKVSIIIIFLTIGGLAFAERNYKNQISQRFVEKSKLETPRDLYVNNCARCHGADGKSQTSLGKSLVATDLTSRSVKRMSVKKIGNTIAYGADNMPAFDKKLSQSEITALAKYVRTIK